MQFEKFQKLLIDTLWNRCAVVFILLLIGFITLTFYIVHYIKTRSNTGIGFWTFIPAFKNRKVKFTLKQQIAELILGILFVIIFTIWMIYPIYKDITNQQFEEVYTQYSRTELSSRGNLFSNGSAFIEINGEKIALELPYGWSNEDFPLGEYFCVVRYGKESKILLEIEILD